ncbi:MAG TPA: hypothetical protein DDW76_21835 [Cyanobacteria bacterium UBA11369]|nr:hypothetical protein [Cyanobacteria bacterium UBA11371]HBE33682.1 hypothetical protein [Cyanobacteria bacterium UBA11368]HBE51341.1 hypothetical protein [Cyanobacteria bacterium UBA11369]
MDIGYSRFLSYSSAGRVVEVAIAVQLEKIAGLRQKNKGDKKNRGFGVARLTLQTGFLALRARVSDRYDRQFVRFYD